MPALPIPPEYLPYIAAIVGFFSFLGWLRAYMRPTPPPAGPASDVTIKAIGAALGDTLTIERAGRDITAAIDRLTKAVDAHRRAVRDRSHGTKSTN